MVTEINQNPTCGWSRTSSKREVTPEEGPVGTFQECHDRPRVDSTRREGLEGGYAVTRRAPFWGKVGGLHNEERFARTNELCF